MRTNLTSLERLEVQIRALPDGTPQGAAWEEALVRWVNAGGHPDLVKGWGWKQWPGRARAGLPRIERGVDLIAEDRAGRLVAIQAKFRNDPDSPVKTGEVQKFVGAYRKQFPRRMLISNASSRARGIKEAVGDTEAELVLRTDLIESLFDWIAAKPLPKPKVIPLPFQREAATAIKKHLKDGGRAQIVMACGSGKTYTTLLAMEALGSRRVLVLAPTLLLVKQLRDEWMRERTSTWATLAVCSDIGKDEGEDNTHVSPGEIGSKPTTDPAEIADFLKSKEPYVVFGTYASSPRIATAQKEIGVPAFDLVVADEAHRIAGAVGKRDKDERAQRVVLDDKGIRAERRLFATATPRVYGGDKKRDGEEIVLESMDDPARFGDEVYKLTFQQAVDLGRLVPYKLLVTIVTDEEVAALIHDRRFVDLQGKPIPADDIATAIAVRRAYKELGISRMISYHGNIKRARAFAQLVQEVNISGTAPAAECVTGAMPIEDRTEALMRLAQADQPYLITNARCLTEGIDVPALDAVAFADPRRSQVDIVQAVGRAMRKPRGTSSKTTGYIILPVFLSRKELIDPEAAVEGSAFAPVLQVLRALKAHDPYRANFFAKVLAAEGNRLHKNGEGIDTILEVSIGKELDLALAKRLEQAVQLRAVEVAADRFEFWLELTRQFTNREKHAKVRDDHIEQGYALGKWVVDTRIARRNKMLSPAKIFSLDELGFVWNPVEDQYRNAVVALKTFVQREGHAQVPDDWKEQDFALGKWLGKQRRRYKSGRLAEQRQVELSSLGVMWEPRKSAFEKQINALRKFVLREKHAMVPQRWVEDGVKLGQFLNIVRTRRARLDEETVSALEDAGIVWDTRALKFESNYQKLLDYQREYGHTQVPRSYSDKSLANWVQNIRSGYIVLSQEHRDRLARIGFSWDPKGDFQAQAISALRNFVRSNGHGRVPDSYIQDNFPLGQWRNVKIRDRARGRLSPALIKELTEIGFSWQHEGMDEIRRRRFDINLAALKRFIAREGHALVPSKWVEGDVRLGSWVDRVRSNRVKLSSKDAETLHELGFVWDTFSARFETELSSLAAFFAREGHTRMPRSFMEGNVALGNWLYSLRNRRVPVTPKLRKALNSIDPNWADS